MKYKSGERLKASDANRMLQSLETGFDPNSVQDDGVKVGKPMPRAMDQVVIQPVQAMAKYNLMQGKSLLGYDAVKKRPAIELSNAQDQDIIDGSNTLYVTNGGVAIAAGDRGWGDVLQEGSWYWLAANTSGVLGYCGLKPGESVLRQDYLGFISMGTITIDGVTCAYATPYSGQSFRMKTIASIAAGTYGDAYIMKPAAGGWTVTGNVLPIWNPVESGIVAATTVVIVSKVNGRLTVVAEACPI